MSSMESGNALIPLYNIDADSLVQLNAIEIMALVLIAIASLLGLYRLLFGPTNPDRIVSADALSVIATVILCIIGALLQSVLYLDVALIYGVLSFVGIIALAKAIEGDVEKTIDNSTDKAKGEKS